MGGVEHDLARQRQVALVGQADLDGDARDGIAQRPVHQLAGDEGLVGDDDFLAVEVGDGVVARMRTGRRCRTACRWSPRRRSVPGARRG